MIEGSGRLAIDAERESEMAGARCRGLLAIGVRNRIVSDAMNPSLAASICNFMVGVGMLWLSARVLRRIFGRRNRDQSEPPGAAIEGTERSFSEWPVSRSHRALAVSLDDLDELRAADRLVDDDSPYPLSKLPRGEESDWGFPAADKEYD